ncbi:MAG TPA: hypothetical protein ENJ61_00390 [Aquifex aeolicus]|uniref:Thioredoxin-like fold domain-containing protein n=1 Tax=Aquifex aeolicus TaxID=63363 RepID=A0A7C5L1L5_AQUAO|nr:hypothetical protein [Aquifex aeolicus]
MAALLAGFAFGMEVQEKKVLEELEKLKGRGMLSEEMMKRIEEYKDFGRRAKEEALRKAKEWEIRREDGRVVVERRKEEEKRKTLPTVYIFISSSVPLEIWWRYAHYLLERNIPGVFVLRGCIGGCRYIRPTLEFVQRFLTEEGRNEEGLPVEVQIDPLKFRDYGVKVVPCVALEGKEKLSCGDWSLEYHLKELGAW